MQPLLPLLPDVRRRGRIGTAAALPHRGTTPVLSTALHFTP